ncbi:hypothetical protein [Streptomyces sp. MAR25Y5]|uniref:hypothetical protein n=1 Tax=Streptomyces sp. MAR25Y5 TaxID=2962028 RepID=UPI0020B6E29E|nr:hypothetical protein [Streptomyces sp. MAR25Y5]MCP3771332.1 hypothetical protein [Streptomyces sp. MAR25Y5]
MSKRQTRKMLRLMASGEPVELTSAMASVKKLARLAFIAQQFGYEYADVRQGGGNDNQLKMLIVPDPDPQARARAAQNWAQYPNAGDGVSVPPLVPNAFELLKARINFDLTGKSAEKGLAIGALAATIGCGAMVVRFEGESSGLVIAGGVWLLLMAFLGVGLVVTRKRNAKFAARLQAAGFTPVADGTGRVRYLPPGRRIPGHGNPFGNGPYGAPVPGTPAPASVPGYGHQPQQQPPMPYAQPAPYGAPPQPPVQAPGPYGRPQPQPPYGQPAQPPGFQPGQNLRQNPHWQPPRP